ncbi:hypothetical protein EJB05_53523, partial [Eragrostis curvula]
MAVQATQPASSSSTAAYPPWVMLEPGADVETTGSYSTADPNTLAVARTSTGYPIGVSLRLKSPPAESRLCFHFPRDVEPGRHSNEVIAAHGDSVLVRVAWEERYDASSTDYFVYNAGTTGAGSSQPPSLSLLPPFRYLIKDSTGILRRGEDELVVAQLRSVHLKEETPAKHVAELSLFRSGVWYTARPRVSGLGNAIDEEKFLSSWFSASVIPVGQDKLCWVSMHGGLIFSNVHDEMVWLRHVPLPEDGSCTEHFYESRNVCVTAGDTVKFVNIFARCCCGGAGGCKCKHSQDAYLIKTWTLRMDSMTWVLDGMMDATELWALDAYQSLPRVQLGFPVVSVDEPHIICFMVSDKKAWLIKVDMRSKMLLSVYSYPKKEELKNIYHGKLLLPSKVSCYLNLYPGGSCHIGIDPKPVSILDERVTYDASNSELLPSGSNTSAEPGAHASEILAALQEISSSGLEGDDMRKAISLLSRGNGHRFRSYFGIPKRLRKDWLLMEINASIR